MPFIGNKVADVAVTVGQGVIDASHIQDASITTADIGNDAITPNKVDDDGTGFQMGSLGLGTAVSGSEKLTVGGTASFSGDITGTLATAAQTNITSVGTLSSLTLGGDLTLPQKIVHSGDTDTYLSFGTDSLSLYTGGTQSVEFIYGNVYLKTNDKALIGYNSSGGAKELIKIHSSDVVRIGEGLPIQIGYTNATPKLEWFYDHSNGNDYKANISLAGNDLEFRGSNGNIEFYTGAVDGASSTEKIRITSDGRVQQLNTSIANSCFDILNTSSSGYGVHIQAGTGSNYSLVVKNKDNTEGFKVLGNGLVQCLRGFTNGQALDIEGETFGRTNSSNVAFGYRQDGNGQLMKIQKSSSDVFIMTNSGRIAQEISEGSAYAATFENTSSGGYGLRVYGGASWADNALLVNDHNGNEAFAVKANGITVSDGKVRQAYVSATYPQNSTTTRTFNIMSLLGHSAGTPYGLVEFLFNIYTNGGNTDCEVHRVTLGGYMHTGYSQDLAWNLVHEVVDSGSTNSGISSITLTGTGGDLNIAYSNGDSNDDAYLRGIMRGWGA